MKINQKSIRLGLGLFVATLSLFFLMLFIFSTQGSMSESQFFNYSVLINCFLLPLIYTGVAFYSVYTEACVQPMNFRKIWKISFLPMFIGGFLSLSVIFIFLNTSGQWVEDSLQRGWFELITANPNQEFLDKNKELVEAMTNPENNIFSWRVFFTSFSVILFFYFLISSIFAVFLKNRRL